MVICQIGQYEQWSLLSDSFLYFNSRKFLCSSALSFDSKYYSFDLKKLKETKPDAWHTHAHGGTGMLKNDEIIVYNENQTTIKYLVEIR